MWETGGCFGEPWGASRLPRRRGLGDYPRPQMEQPPETWGASNCHYTPIPTSRGAQDILEELHPHSKLACSAFTLRSCLPTGASGRVVETRERRLAVRAAARPSYLCSSLALAEPTFRSLENEDAKVNVVKSLPVTTSIVLLLVIRKCVPIFSTKASVYGLTGSHTLPFAQSSTFKVTINQVPILPPFPSIPPS